MLGVIPTTTKKGDKMEKQKTFMEMVKEDAQYPNPAYDMCNYAKATWHNWANKQKKGVKK